MAGEKCRYNQYVQAKIDTKNNLKSMDITDILKHLPPCNHI